MRDKESEGEQDMKPEVIIQRCSQEGTEAGAKC